MHLARLVTRLVGLWILAGATLKLLYGTPADLPELVRNLPLGLGLTFKLALTAEFLVGAFALLRPSKGWLPALLLTGAFLVVLVSQVAAGDESCGCFGTAVTISPWVMLAIDGVSLLLLLVTRPWRAAGGDRSEAPWLAAVVILLALGALPWLLDREKTATEAGPGFVALYVDTYRGMRLADTPLWPVLSEDQRIADGVIVIWRKTCELCGEHLENMYNRELGDRPVVLLELPPGKGDEGVEPAVTTLPEGDFVHASVLPAEKQWMVTPPAHIEVVGGKVTVATEGHDTLDLDK